LESVKIENLDYEIDLILEWTVFVHLERKTDLELILLKGHLLLETISEIVLKRNDIKNLDNYSFHRKILILESINFENRLRKKFIISSLREINRLRNKVAHEFLFDITNGEFETWASKILNNLKGEKFTKYTFRTKIVHSFSVLTKNILEMKTLKTVRKNYR
jgi:hypothetical protein